MFAKSTRRHGGNPDPSPPRQFEALEARDLPTTAFLQAHLLRIEGSSAGDDIQVKWIAPTQSLRVELSGIEIFRASGRDVASIRIDAGDGDDHVQVDPAIAKPLKIFGGAGNDKVVAGGGPSVLMGGPGDDTLIGGPAGDRLLGGEGDDYIDGAGGPDILSGDGGSDHLDGGPGVDRLDGGGGNDFLEGGGDNDRLFGNDDDDIVEGNDGDDRVVGGAGDDILSGGGGANWLTGGVAGLDINSDTGAVIPSAAIAAALANANSNVESTEVLTAAEVTNLLQRASAATATNDAVIAVVDRNGRILGVLQENGISPSLLADPANLLVFAVDGAVAKARTAAFFANNGAPLTSRAIQFISQSTILEREVNSNPNLEQGNPNSTINGPGFVAPIGIGGHFPPVPFTPSANLFAIEHTNRDNDIPGMARFNINPAALTPGAALFAPSSYGVVSGLNPNAQGRGIATLPGGVPLYKNGQLVGGIGVFYPGATGFASEENSSLSADYNPAKPDRSFEAEYAAFVAAGGAPSIGFGFQGPVGNAQAAPNFGLPFGRIDIDGINVRLFGPTAGIVGVQQLVSFGATLGTGSFGPQVFSPGSNGLTVTTGWIVPPTNSPTSGLTAGDVQRIIEQGIMQASITRANIRLRLTDSGQLRPGAITAMVFAVSDTDGTVLGLYRMPDATVFSIGVAVAKSRNTAYYDDPSAIQPVDQIDYDRDGSPDVPAGASFTNRTFRYAALPFFPSGIDGAGPGPFSILRDGQANPNTGLNNGPPLPVSAFQSVMGFDAFNPNTNFRDPGVAANENGVVFFPGSSAVYKDVNGDGVLEIVGGFGVSGDGVDQDDVVTYAGINGYNPPPVIRADQFMVSGIRLPYIKFSRNANDRQI